MKKEQADRARALIEELASRPPYNEHGGVNRLQQDLGISAPALLKIRKGGGVSEATGRRIAILSGLDPDTFQDDMPASRFRILEAVLIVHPSRWPAPAVAAARAGVWDSDVDAAAWISRLDQLAKSLKHLAKQG